MKFIIRVEYCCIYFAYILCSYNINIGHNLGGETTSFLQYIVDNYDDLPNYVFFSQAHPLEHWIYGVQNLNSYLLKLIQTNISFVSLSQTVGYEGAMCYDDGGFKCCSEQVQQIYDLLVEKNGIIDKNKRAYPFLINYNGLFIASRNAIIRNTKDFYFTLLSQLVTGYKNPDVNLKTLHYAIERSWWFMFDEIHLSLDRLCNKKDHNRFSHLKEACNIYSSNDKYRCHQSELGGTFDEFKKYIIFLASEQ